MCWSLTTLTDNTSNSDDISNDPLDPADVMDTGFYEELLHDSSTLSFPDHPSTSEAPTNPNLTERPDQTEVGEVAKLVPPQEMSSPVVDKVPFGSPGAPIPDKPQGPSAYEAWQAMFEDSAWAPFCSGLEWDIAQWAKMRGRTPSALSGLLEIPGVRIYP